MKNAEGYCLAESAIVNRLCGPFPAPAYLVLPQVRNGTGYQRQPRTADALIASTWPSRGLWLAGVEVKISRSDWRRELADAEKSAAMQQWCRYWYIATPAGLIPQAELPPTWGLIECTEKTATITVKAPELEPKPPDICLLCSILRTVADVFVPRDDLRQLASEEAAKLSAHHGRELTTLRSAIAEFEKAAGLSLRGGWAGKRLGELVKLVRDSGLLNGKDRLRTLRTEATDIAEACAKLIGD